LKEETHKVLKQIISNKEPISIYTLLDQYQKIEKIDDIQTAYEKLMGMISFLVGNKFIEISTEEREDGLELLVKAAKRGQRYLNISSRGGNTVE
jgi:hypothetical protein